MKKIAFNLGLVPNKLNSYDKRDYFNFEIVNFPFLDGDVPRFPSYGVSISQLIRFATGCCFIVGGVVFVCICVFVCVRVCVYVCFVCMSFF